MYLVDGMPAPYGHLDGIHAFHFNRPDIARAMVMVGYGPYAPPFWHAWPFHILNFLLPLSFLTGAGPAFDLAAHYRFLPLSFRSYLSERLAMGMVKLWAEAYLDVFQLTEVEYILRAGVPLVRSGRKKDTPDLAGRNQDGDWVVLESKGRLGRSKSGAMRKAINQAKNVASINGQAPVVRAGAVLSKMAGRRLQMEIEDPPSEGKVHWEIDDRKFLATCYYRALTLLEHADVEVLEVHTRYYDTVTFRLPAGKMTFGILSSYRKALISGADHLPFDDTRLNYYESSRTESVGLDGLLIRFSDELADSLEG